MIENGSRIGIDAQEFEKAVLSSPIEQKAEDALEQIANNTAYQVLANVGFDLPLISAEDFRRITRRFSRVQDHGSKGEYDKDCVKSRDKRSPRPTLPERRHIELELSF